MFVLRVAGRTKVIAEERRLDDVNTCVEDVLAGQVPARVVFTFDPLRSGPPLACRPPGACPAATIVAERSGSMSTPHLSLSHLCAPRSVRKSLK